MLRFLVRDAAGCRLYWLDATDEADARRRIALVDARRPERSRAALAGATLETISDNQFAALPRTLKAARLKERPTPVPSPGA